MEPAVRYHSEPVKSPHFWWAKGEVILQITAIGPTAIEHLSGPLFCFAPCPLYVR